MKTAKTEVAQAPARAAPPPDTKIYKVDAGNAPSKGPKLGAGHRSSSSRTSSARSARASVPTIKQIEEKYGGKVRISFRNFPLPFHNNAEAAAEAGEAANEQGKFWEMHDKMFANQQALDRASLEKYAGEIGLDVGKFKADLDSGKYKDAVNKDVEYAKTVNVNGTPAFFINGHFINGAMPLRELRAGDRRRAAEEAQVAQRTANLTRVSVRSGASRGAPLFFCATALTLCVSCARFPAC